MRTYTRNVPSASARCAEVVQKPLHPIAGRSGVLPPAPIDLQRYATKSANVSDCLTASAGCGRYRYEAYLTR